MMLLEGSWGINFKHYRALRSDLSTKGCHKKPLPVCELTWAFPRPKFSYINRDETLSSYIPLSIPFVNIFWYFDT